MRKAKEKMDKRQSKLDDKKVENTADTADTIEPSEPS